MLFVFFICIVETDYLYVVLSVGLSQVTSFWTLRCPISGLMSVSSLRGSPLWALTFTLVVGTPCSIRFVGSDSWLERILWWHSHILGGVCHGRCFHAMTRGFEIRVLDDANMWPPGVAYWCRVWILCRGPWGCSWPHVRPVIDSDLWIDIIIRKKLILLTWN